MTILAAAILGLVLSALAVWCTAGSRVRRALGVVLGVSVLLPPWLLPERPFLLRGVWALAAFTTTMRVVDVSCMTWPLRRRAFHVMSVVESRRLVPCAPRLDSRRSS